VDADAATVGRLWALRGTVRALARIGALTTPSHHTPYLYLTEFGYFHSGPYAISEKKRARYLPRGFDKAQRDPLVREMLQYTFVTTPYGRAGSFFDLGIVRMDGTALPPYTALRAWVTKAAKRGRVAKVHRPLKLPPAPG
jgi:hypothetical protein